MSPLAYDGNPVGSKVSDRQTPSPPWLRPARATGNGAARRGVRGTDRPSRRSTRALIVLPGWAGWCRSCSRTAPASATTRSQCESPDRGKTISLRPGLVRSLPASAISTGSFGKLDAAGLRSEPAASGTRRCAWCLSRRAQQPSGRACGTRFPSSRPDAGQRSAGERRNGNRQRRPRRDVLDMAGFLFAAPADPPLLRRQPTRRIAGNQT